MTSIQAYASQTSVSAGGTIDFMVSFDHGGSSPQFTIDFFREGATEQHVGSQVTGVQAESQATPPDFNVNGCAWPKAYTLTVPNDWGGVYIARLTGSTGDTAEVLFVVRAANPGSSSKILLALTVNTAQAYNETGGSCLYSFPPTVQVPTVSFLRPGGLVDTFRTYGEQRFISWAERNGFAIEYCTGIDLHRDPNFLANYQLLLSVGHDEYWSKEMRDNVEAFIGNGGNMTFFSGNVCWWQVRFEDSNCRMVCHKSDESGGTSDPTTDQTCTIHWFDSPVLRPENTMTGVSFRKGAGWWGGPIIPERRFRGYTVVNASHWVFNGTGLANGNTFGAGHSVDNTIIGYETDAGVPGANGTPGNFVVLATADLSDWPGSKPAPPSFAPEDQQAWLTPGKYGQPGAATMGMYQRNGTVITVGTSNWAGGLSSGGNWGPVDQITQNIVKTLCPSTVATGAVATFVNTDTSTQGNWHGVYGADGYSVANDSQNIPSYATLAVQNQNNWTWAASTTDPRALQTGSGTGRIAATWYGNSPFGFDVNLTDGNVHRFALYVVDWDNNGRVETVQIVDANTGAVLDTRNLSNFTNGIYLIWDLSGHVKVNVTWTTGSGVNAVVSGVFFK